MDKAILVAGGAGYIGSHVCKALAAAGYLPVVLDDLSTGHRDFVRWGPFYQASVSDAAIVSDAVRTHSIRAVIDLAGSIEVGESVVNPLKYYANNVAVKIAFLATLRTCGVVAFVLSSTAAVYGEPSQIPIPESHPLVPKNPYGRTKLMFEQLLADVAAAASEFNWIALRYFNAAGASPEGEIGEWHDPETHLIPRACMAVLGTLPALEIFGNDYPTPDGTAIRDYVHVTDLAAAHVLAVRSLLDGGESAIYNLGNGHGTSIGEVLQCFNTLGYKVPHHFRPRRQGDPVQLVADNTFTKARLGWQPKHTELPEIVSSAFNWHRKIIAYKKSQP